MTDKTIDLDQHRGMAAQKATELRRLHVDVEANEKVLRLRQDELETHLLRRRQRIGGKPLTRPATSAISLPTRQVRRIRGDKSLLPPCLPISSDFLKGKPAKVERQDTCEHSRWRG
jgi:hypothetical protein